MNKTAYRFDWENGYTKSRRLSRSFETREAAEAFAEGKHGTEIYVSKGKYKVEWIKTTGNND